MTASRATGKPIRRVEDARFLTGRGSYVDDVQPEGVAYLAFARSPYACARVTRVNVDRAKTALGVIAVATGDDVPELGDVPVIPLPFAKVPPHPPLARGRVAAMGFPIAAVAAESVAEAWDAADLVEVEYEPGPSVAFAEEALLSGSLGDYAVPRATDIPPMVLGHTVTPTPLNPLGAKGVGEAGTNGCPPAIANAVIDALSPLGVRHLDLPFTSDRVWEAIRSAGG